jgi:hypothetical protein
LAVAIIRLVDPETLALVVSRVSNQAFISLLTIQWAAIGRDSEVWRAAYLAEWGSTNSILHHDHMYYLPLSRRGSRESSVVKDVVKRSKGRIVQKKPMKGINRDWKDMYRRRLALDKNWTTRNYRMTTISGHTDSGLTN